jgi:hypothetical protein
VESKEQIGILLQIPKHQIELFSLSLSLSSQLLSSSPSQRKEENSTPETLCIYGIPSGITPFVVVPLIH